MLCRPVRSITFGIVVEEPGTATFHTVGRIFSTNSNFNLISNLDYIDIHRYTDMHIFDLGLTWRRCIRMAYIDSDGKLEVSSTARCPRVLEGM